LLYSNFGCFCDTQKQPKFYLQDMFKDDYSTKTSGVIMWWFVLSFCPSFIHSFVLSVSR